MNWAGLADRAPSATVEEIRAELSVRREQSTQAETDTQADSDAVTEPVAPQPIRVVADADVLAADLLVGDDARRALSPLWRHSWTTLVASDPLLADTVAVIEAVANAELAVDWRTLAESWREPVAQPAGDHPALASAYRGGAMHVLSFDEALTGPTAGAALNQRVSVSARTPAAFATLFDPAGLYSTVGDDYPGPDREQRFESV